MQQVAVGFNASPPPNDGSQTADNEADWDDVKGKLADPIKTLADNIDDAVATMGGKLINTDADENNAMAGSLAFTSSELTIATGSVTATRSHHTIDTEADAGSDDLDTIATGSVSDGAVLVVRAESAARTVVVKHSTGNILMADDSDFDLDDDEKSITLQRRGANWHEITRAPGGLSGATATQMEAASATDAAVTPAVAERHPSASKAWCNWTYTTGTPAVDLGYNVSSLDDDATGQIGINFTTAMSSANYAAQVNAEGSAVAGDNSHIELQETGQVTVQMESGNATADGDNDGSVIVFGDQ